MFICACKKQQPALAQNALIIKIYSIDWSKVTISRTGKFRFIIYGYKLSYLQFMQIKYEIQIFGVLKHCKETYGRKISIHQKKLYHEAASVWTSNA